MRRIERRPIPARLLARLAIAAAAVVTAAVLVAVAAADAAVRYKRQGEATLGGEDVLGASVEICELGGSRRLFVSVEGRGECVAYYPTGSIDSAAVAIVFLEGDVPGSYRRNTARLAQHRAQVVAALQALSRAHGLPFVFLARPGTFGSTGNHADRRSEREYRIVDAALDRLKQRHGIDRLVLTGQSGGATAVGAVLTFGRTDVACATPASGGYDLEGMLAWHAERLGLADIPRENGRILTELYSVIEHVAGIRADARRRIFVVGDSEDKVTPFPLQRRFAERAAAAGHHARLIEARGSGNDRHGLGHVGLRLAALCAKGASDDEIRRAAGG